MPDHVKTQFAGNMGVLSLGLGYSFFNGKLESDMFYGYVGTGQSDHSIQHLTQKNTFYPYSLPVNDVLVWKPVSFGLSFLYKVGDTNRETWLFLPERYPNSYYFATAFHALVTVGTSMTYKGPGILRNTGMYLEAGTTALYIRNWLSEDFVKLSDIVSLGIGIKKMFN